MLELMSHSWWILVLRGLLAITFGVLAFAMPGVTLEVLVLFFGAYALVDGIFNIITAFAGRAPGNRWGLVLLQGLLGVAIGLMTMVAPGVTAAVLLLYVAAWAIVTGVLEIAAAVRLRNEIQGEIWLGLGGLLSIAFGLLLIASPLAGAVGLIWMLAGYAVAYGVSLIVLGVRLRRLAPPRSTTMHRPAHAHG